MSASSAVILVSVILLLAGYITKRRFGVLGLALVAGAALHVFWGHVVIAVFEQFGVPAMALPLSVIVTIGIIVLPSCALLMSGPMYRKHTGRVIGSLAFATLALALITEPLASALSTDALGQALNEFFSQNRTLIITAAIGLALCDLLATKTIKKQDEKGKH